MHGRQIPTDTRPLPQPTIEGWAELVPNSHTLRKLYFHFLLQWIFLQSYPIHCERKWKYSFLSVPQPTIERVGRIGAESPYSPPIRYYNSYNMIIAELAC